MNRNVMACTACTDALPTAARASLPTGLTGLANLLREWQERRRSRRQLVTMDDRLLRDIGLSRADLAQEYMKHFWQD